MQVCCLSVEEAVGKAAISVLMKRLWRRIMILRVKGKVECLACGIFYHCNSFIVTSSGIHAKWSLLEEQKEIMNVLLLQSGPRETLKKDEICFPSQSSPRAFGQYRDTVYF